MKIRLRSKIALLMLLVAGTCQELVLATAFYARPYNDQAESVYKGPYVNPEETRSLRIALEAAEKRAEEAKQVAALKHFDINEADEETRAVADGASYDYIIVGFGTAGATLARFLSDPVNGQYRNSVLVLESGENRNQDPNVMQNTLFGTSPLAVGTKYSETYSALLGTEISTGFAGFLYSEGRLWGGGSAHNGLIAVRGTKALYDSWATITGLPQLWSYNSLLPLMLYMEKYTPLNSSADYLQRGSSGSLCISSENYSGFASNAFNIALSTASGAAIRPDYNVESAATAISPNQLYVSDVVPGMGQRCHSANSFSPTPLDNPNNPIIDQNGNGLNGRNLTVISHATVNRVIFTPNKEAKGVEFVVTGVRGKENCFKANAAKKVILCAGGTFSPAILQRSGVGPQSVIDQLGITPVCYNSNVGTNVSNHYGSGAIMSANNPVNLAPLTVLCEAFIDLSPYFVGSPDNVRRHQMLYSGGPFFFPSFAALRGMGIEPFAVIGATNSFGMVNITPRSLGCIAIADTDPLTTPVVNFKYYSDGDLTDPASDASHIVAAFKVLKDTATALGEVMIYPTPAMYSAGDYALYQAAKDLPFVTYHISGSCRMSPTILTGVVDGRLHVHGVKNLMVADCSIEPVTADGNTAYAAYLIGMVAAKICGNTTLP